MSLKYIMDDEEYETATYGEAKMSVPDTSHLKEVIEVSYYNRDGKEITVQVEVGFEYAYSKRGEEYKKYNTLQMEEGWKALTGESECFHSWNVPK